MPTTTCDTCLKPTAPFQCGLCQNNLCKKCSQFLDDSAFEFMDSPPEKAKHPTYCNTCYAEQVLPLVEEYDSQVTRAKNMFVFFKGDGKDVRNLALKRADKSVEINDCDDYHDTILRLAFMAVQKNCNVLVDVETQSHKIHDGSYVILRWSGKGTPASGDDARLQRFSLAAK